MALNLARAVDRHKPQYNSFPHDVLPIPVVVVYNFDSGACLGRLNNFLLAKHNLQGLACLPLSLGFKDRFAMLKWILSPESLHFESAALRD